MYLFVGSIFLYIGVVRLVFNKKDHEIENHKIDFEVLSGFFELKSYHIIFIVLTISIMYFFNLIIGAFYLIFIILGLIGAFFKRNI